jgi:hypothetical protein
MDPIESGSGSVDRRIRKDIWGRGEQPAVARSPAHVRAGPGGNILFTGGHGPPDKSLTGRSRPWIRFSARKTEKYINPTKTLIIFAIGMEKNSVSTIDR